jgi:hypothetical protein
LNLVVLDPLMAAPIRERAARKAFAKAIWCST